MTQFKVGDRVRQIGDEYWRGMEGVYDGRRTNGDNGDDYLFDYFIPDEGSKYSDGTSASRFVGRPCGMDVGSFELIQPTQTATDRLERLEAFVARVDAQKGHTSYTDEARAIVAELEPVDEHEAYADALLKQQGWHGEPSIGFAAVARMIATAHEDGAHPTAREEE